MPTCLRMHPPVLPSLRVRSRTVRSLTAWASPRTESLSTAIVEAFLAAYLYKWAPASVDSSEARRKHCAADLSAASRPATRR